MNTKTEVKELKFSQVWPEKMGEWAGMPTYFEHMICAMYSVENHKTFNELWNMEKVLEENSIPLSNGFIETYPKLHTIRRGKKYKAGQIVKPISISPDGKEFQFAPELKIVSVQDIEIRWGFTNGHDFTNVLVKGLYLSYEEKIFLSINDGFEGTTQFYKYFNERFKGQILHFTDLRY